MLRKPVTLKKFKNKKKYLPPSLAPHSFLLQSPEFQVYYIGFQAFLYMQKLYPDMQLQIESYYILTKT